MRNSERLVLLHTAGASLLVRTRGAWLRPKHRLTITSEVRGAGLKTAQNMRKLIKTPSSRLFRTIRARKPLSSRFRA